MLHCCTLCGRSVPNRQPSCERWPPASWAVVEAGVRIMDGCSAAWWFLLLLLLLLFCTAAAVCSVVGKMWRSIISSF